MFLVFGYDIDPRTGQSVRCTSTGRHLTAAENARVDSERNVRAKSAAIRARRPKAAPKTQPERFEL